MLQEQRAEAEELYEARAVRLEGLLEEWKTKHAALRRRFSLETEGFRRDADNIGRYASRCHVGAFVRGGRAICCSVFEPSLARGQSRHGSMSCPSVDVSTTVGMPFS